MMVSSEFGRSSTKASYCANHRETNSKPTQTVAPSNELNQPNTRTSSTIRRSLLTTRSCWPKARMSPKSSQLKFKWTGKVAASIDTASVELSAGGATTRSRTLSSSVAHIINHHHHRSSSLGNKYKNINNMNNNKININHKLKPIYSSKLAFLAIVTFTTILLLTCLANQQVSSLNCYTCSSADNPGCDEPFTGRSNITDTDCEKHIGKPAKVCRKIVQYLENKKVVIRSCGWIDEHEDKKPMCYKRSGTFALMMESCICYEDMCNHSTSLVPNQSVSILLASVSMIFYYLISYNHHHNQRDMLH